MALRRPGCAILPRRFLRLPPFRARHGALPPSPTRELLHWLTPGSPGSSDSGAPQRVAARAAQLRSGALAPPQDVAGSLAPEVPASPGVQPGAPLGSPTLPLGAARSAEPGSRCLGPFPGCSAEPRSGALAPPWIAAQSPAREPRLFPSAVRSQGQCRSLGCNPERWEGSRPRAQSLCEPRIADQETRRGGEAEGRRWEPCGQGQFFGLGVREVPGSKPG